MKTFDEYAKQSPEQDPLDTIRNYRDEVRLDLLKNGEWDDEMVAEVDNALLEKAQAQGIDLGEDPVSTFNRPRKDQDEDILSRFSVDENVRAAASELRALKTAKDLYAHDPAEYQSKLEAAELTFNEAATPEARNAARRQALTSGEVPYVKYQDADGNYQMEVSPELAPLSGNDAALAKVFEANPALDKGDIPELRRRLQVPDGYEVPAFMLDRRNDFSQVVNEVAKNDPSVTRDLNRLRNAIDAGNEGNLDPLLSSIDSSLSAAGISSEFSPEERKNFLKDYVVSLSSPKVDEANVDANLRKLSTGEVHVPFGVFLNKPLFDKTMAESTLIPAAQKEALTASRNDRLATFAQDTFPLLTRRNPEFAAFYDKAKSEGKADAEILDTFMSDPENQSTLLDFAQGTIDSVAEGFGGLALYPLALAGNETARDVVSGLQQQDADRRAYAQLFGKNLGMGYDLTRLIAPVAADVGVSLLTSGAASGLVGAKTTAKSAIKSTLASALKGETKSLARSFAEGAARRQGVEAATNSLDSVLSAAGRDIAQKFTQSATTASYLATAFNRSAGATYVQLHNTLEKQKNPDGSPKYSPEQAREIALNHGLLAGTLTAAVTGGFSMLGAAGMERIYDGLTRRQLNGVFDRLKRDWGKLAPEVREGLDTTSADAFLSSVVRKAVTPMWQSVGRPIAEEGAEEGLDEFLQYFNQQVATGDKIDVVDAVKQAGYAAMLGGAMGGTVTGINSAMRGDQVSVNDETAVRRQTLLDTARKLDAAHSPNTAAILRRFAATGIPTRPEESLPEGDAATGDVEAPGGQSVAEPEAVMGFREELQNLASSLPELQIAPENETEGQKARRELRIAQSQTRAQELESLIANYDVNTIPVGTAPPEPAAPRRVDPGTTVLPSGPTIEIGAEAGTDTELDVADILYSPPADSPLNRDEAAAIAEVLNGEQPAASNREVIDRYLGSQGVVTEGLSDADATALLGVADAEEAVRVLGNRQAPLAPDNVTEELEAFDFSQGTQPFLEAVAVRGKPEHRKAAKLLLKFPGAQVTMVNMPGASFAGAFVPSTGQVLINSARRGPRGAVDTALHELLHAATEESVLNPTPEQQAILKRLDRVRQTILKRTKDRGMRYALSNNAEFVTHAFTDPEFLKQVGELTPKGEKNWAQVIIDTIRDLINGRSRTESERISESLMNDLMALVESGVPSMRQQVDATPETEASTDEAEGPRLQPADDTHTAASVEQLAESFAPEGVELTIDFDELARDMEGVSGVNAEDMVATMVNRDVARQAGLAALGEDVPADEAERLADTFRLTITGNLPDSDIAFYRGNTTARERLVRYLQGAVNALWERLKLRFDPRTAMYVDRIAREVAVANDGYRTRSQIKQFDPNNPAETEAMLRFQPAEGDETPEFRYTNFTEVNDGNVLYSSTPADMQKPGWLSRMFTRRDDLRRPLSALKVDGKALYGVMEAKFNRLNPLYEKAIKEENPDMDIVKQAVGSTAPLLTPDEENRINTEVDRRMETASNIAQPRIDAARAVKDKAVRAARRANSVESEDTALAVFEESKRQANADQERAMTAIQEWSRAEKDRSMADRAAELRRVQGLAMQQLQGNAPLTYKWASEMRDTVNEFQDRLAKLYKTTRPELSATIDRSRGVYLVRSYKFHQEPAMAEMILNDPRFDELRATSIEYFGRELAQDKFETLKNDPNFRNTPESDLMEIARQDVEDQARLLFEDFIAGHENQYTASASGSLKTEFQRFMTKRNLDPEISAILQEIEDPAYNLGRTLSAVSGILFSQKMLAAVKKDGLETGTIITKAEKDANPAKYRNWEPLVAASANSQAYAPLAGYYASPEDKMAWDAAFNASRNAAKDTSGKAAETLNKLILGAAGASLGVATLGSPGYQSRNVVGGLIMALAQGVNVFSPKGAKSIKTSFENAFSKNPSDQEFLEKMVALRVLGDGAQIQYLRDFLTRYRQNPLGAMDWAAEQGMKISPEAVKALGKGKSGWNKMVDFLGRTAEFTETWQNTAIYLHELQAMKDTGLYTEQEAEQEAARRTKMVTASKSEASQALNAFSKHPVSALIAPFARFKSEMVRTVVNTYRLGIADVKKGRELNNDVLVDHGLQRLASAATIHGLVSILVPLILQRIMGISDDEDKAIRAAMPEYSKNSSFWYDRNADGGIRTWDLTFANPFALLADPLTQMIRATRTGDAAEIPKAAQRFFTEELLGENILAGNVLDLSRNRDETTNMPIWLESDDTTEKMLKGAMHLVEGSYTPAAAKKIYQAYQATNRPVKDDEQFFFTPAGVLLGAVAPVKPRDYPVKDLAYRAFRNLSKTNSELWLITNPISSPKGMGEGEAANLYGERVQAATKIWKQAHQLSKSFASMGMTKGQILSVMQDAGLSKDRSEKAIRGFTDRPILASDKLKDIREIDPRRHDELVRAMRSQPRLIDVR